jgi:hypothetical protein
MKTFLLAEDHDLNDFVKSMEAQNDSIWITNRLDALGRAFDRLDEKFFKDQSRYPKKLAILLLASEAPSGLNQSLQAFFKEAIILPEEAVLPLESLLDVLNSKKPEKYIIGGQVNELTHTVTLIRGDLSFIVVPQSTFRPSGSESAGTQVLPDFSCFAVDDYGQTIRFGEYESSVDAILHEFDPIYRRKLKAERLKKEKGFGASLRRLRLQKGLRQADFPDINPREIGRIERSEVKPRKKTIERLAKALGVSPSEIESY